MEATLLLVVIVAQQVVPVVQVVQIRQVAKHVTFVMDIKSVRLAMVTAHTSIPLQIKELPVLIVRTDGVVDATAQARFNAKNVCSCHSI